MIHRSESKILELARAGSWNEAVQLAEENLDMVTGEGLWGGVADGMALLARLEMGLGRRREAEVWARKSWERLVAMGFLGGEGGFEAWGVDAFLELVGEGVTGMVR